MTAAPRRVWLALLLLVLTGLHGAAAAGFQVVSVPDPGSTPITVGIWYPSDVPPTTQKIGLDTQAVAAGGTIAGHGLPLIVMSHGQGGQFSNHYDTAIALAQAGFVAAALTHTGDNVHDQSRVVMIQDRSRQLRVVTDWLLSTWPAHDRLDASRIGVWGFSAGGFTALVAAGGTPDLSLLGPHCAGRPAEFTCALIARHHVDPGKTALPQAAWVHDPRIKAAVVAAPALGFTFGKSGLQAVRIPVQLWRAEQDQILPQPFYAQAVDDALPVPPDYHVVPGAGHLDFLPPCSPEKTALLPGLCASQPGFDRAAFHRTFNATVVAFFSAKLKQP